MVETDEIAAQAERARTGLEEAYGLKARTLAAAVQQAGRRLPGDVQSHCAKLLQAEQMRGHPKLLHQIRQADLAAAETAIRRHVDSIDRGALRRGAFLNWLAQTAFYIFLVFGGMLLWLTLSGRI